MAVVIPTISSGGQVLDPKIQLLSLEVRRELNRIPEAKLIFVDGSVAKRSFDLSNSAFFAPGKTIEIALRYEGDTSDTPVFEGLVVRHAIETQAEGSVLRVELKDPAFKLTRQRKSAAFRKQTDDDVIRKLITGAELTAGELASTKPKHAELIQYYASDWDFIVARADVQGLVVDVDRGKISVLPIKLGDSADLKLEHGMSNISELDLEIDGAQQLAELTSVGWDIAEQKLTAPEQAADPKIKVGNLDAKAIARDLGGAQYTLLHPAPLVQPELKAWADARLARSRFSLLRGHAVIDGNAKLAPLNTVELAGVSDRFNGKTLVSAVIHRVDHDGWHTELRFGLTPEWFARQPDLADVPAAGLLPPIHNLQIATVAAYEKDPLGEHRIKIKLPALADKEGSVWARVARPDAGEDRGALFWPRPKDEVIVGFLDGDPRQAIVLGALFSSKNAPPKFVGPPTEANDKGAIVSKGGLTIGFDDKDKKLTIQTSEKNQIVVDDKTKTITIKDANDNTITMSDKGITLKSGSDFKIEASGKVTIKGSAVDVQ